MKKGLVVLIVVGAVLLTAGGALFGVAIANNALSTSGPLVTNNHDINESFNKVNIAIDVADLEFKKAEGDKCKVVCVEKEKVYHEVKVVDDTLKIEGKDTSEWYEHIFNYANGMKVTVYLPEKTYSDVTIASSTGDIIIDNAYTFTNFAVSLSTGNINIKNVTSDNVTITSSTGNQTLENMHVFNKFTVKASTGRLNLNNISCSSDVTLETSTGKIDLDNLITSKHLSVKASTGDVTFKNIDANTIKIETDTGDVSGNILTDKLFRVDTHTGHKNYPTETRGELCEIYTHTGNIDVTVGAK